MPRWARADALARPMPDDPPNTIPARPAHRYSDTELPVVANAMVIGATQEMDLELSDDEAALRDNVREVLAGLCPAVRRADGLRRRRACPQLVVDDGRARLAGLRDRGGARRARPRVRRVHAGRRRARSRCGAGPAARHDHPVRPGRARARRRRPADLPRRRGRRPTTGTLAWAEDSGWGLDGDPHHRSARRRPLGSRRREARGPRRRGRRRAGGHRQGRRRARRVRRLPRRPRLGRATVLDPTLPLADIHLASVVVDADRVLAPARRSRSASTGSARRRRWRSPR